jgi:hypothetical protein
MTNDIGRLRKEFERPLPVRGEGHFIALQTKERIEQIPHSVMVINHEYCGHGTSRIMKVNRLALLGLPRRYYQRHAVRLRKV